MAKIKKANDRRFVDTKAWVEDIRRSHGEDIRRNQFQRMAMGRMEDVEFLISMVEKLTKGDLAKLRKLDVADEPEEETPAPVESEDLVAV